MSDSIRAAGASPDLGRDGAGEGAGSRGPGDREAGAHLKTNDREAGAHLKTNGREAGAHLDKRPPQATTQSLHQTKLVFDDWPRLSDDAILAEIRRVASLVEGPVYRCRFLEVHSTLRHHALHRRFGSWRAALVRAGLSHLAVPARSAAWRARLGRCQSDADLLDELRRVARVLGRDTLRSGDIQRLGRFRPELFARRFGSWAAAVERAGLRPVCLRRRYSRAACFDNLRGMWLHCRRPPRGVEMNHLPSTIGEHVYRYRFGSWTQALREFVAQVNATPHDPLLAAVREWSGHLAAKGRAQCARPPLPSSRHRNASAVLRHKIMTRDRFRCVLCGASPATDADCTLELDHIRPYSQGGRTVEANLRTLCHACNVGRGPHAFAAIRARAEEGR